MWSKLKRIGLIVIVIALLLGNLAVCIEAANDPKKCRGDKPDECNGKCVNLKNDDQNCGSCGNACNQGEICHNSRCVSPGNNEKGTSSNKKATCTDGKKDGKETDIDCGGSTCPACADEKTCETNMDCSSGVCTNGICQSPTCTDGVMNGGETGVDCGGKCNPCPEKVIGNITTAPGRTLKPIPGIGSISEGPAQNAPGTPNPTYKFVFDTFDIGTTRALYDDTDYLGFGVSVKNVIFNGSPQTKKTG